MSGKFFSTLRELRSGTTLEELDSAISEVVSAVKTTRKSGEIIFKLKVRPPRTGTGNYLHLEGDVVTKVPKQDKGDTIFFPLSDNSLTRNDPNQMPLQLRSVESSGSAPGSTVDTSTGEIVLHA